LICTLGTLDFHSHSRDLWLSCAFLPQILKPLILMQTFAYTSRTFQLSCGPSHELPPTLPGCLNSCMDSCPHFENPQFLQCDHVLILSQLIKQMILKGFKTCLLFHSHSWGPWLLFALLGPLMPPQTITNIAETFDSYLDSMHHVGLDNHVKQCECWCN